MKQRGNLLLLAFVAVCLLSLCFGSIKGDGDSAGDGSTAVGVAGEVVAEAPPEPVAVEEAGEETIRLLVLNGAGVAGLAGETGLDVAMIGCVAEGVDNAPHERFKRSLLVNRRLAAAVASDLAARLGGIPVIKEQDARAGEDAVLVLGADHGAVAAAIRVAAGR